MSGAEWIAIIGGATGFIGGLLGCCGLVIAWKKLGKIAENQRMDILKVVLEIESQINDRKVEFDKSAKNLRETASSGQNNEEKMEIDKDYFLAMKEGYFNALDRLCFCIRNKYILEADWEKEYRNMLRDTINKYKDDFGVDSPHKNMIKLNDEWQDSIVK